MAQRERNVKIVVSATAKGLAQVQSKVSKFQAAVEKTKARRTALSTAKKDAAAASIAYDAATAGVRKYVAAVEKMRKSGRGATVDGAHLRQAFDNTKRAAKEAKLALDQKQLALHRLTQVGNANAAQMRANKVATAATAASIKQEAAAAASAKTQLDKLNKTTDRTAKTQAIAGKSVGVATVAIRKQAAVAKQSADWAERQGAAWASRKGRGSLGLRPYELTNLSYQVNDVVSGLAMGQRPMQIFAQQSGQIIQIFPKIMMGLMRMIPVIGVVGSALAGPVLALIRLGKEADNLRFFSAQLEITGLTAQYSAEGLSDLATQASRSGMSLDDAKKALMAFTKAGVGGGALGGFLQMAEQLATVTGEDVPSAAERLAQAFDGGVDSIRELDREMNFLTADQYANIRALSEQGDEVGALEIATDALSTKLQNASDKMGAGGEWSQAVDNLSEGWGRFMGWMEKSWLVDQMSKSLQGLAFAANAITIVASDQPLGADNARLEGLAGGRGLTRDEVTALVAEIGPEILKLEARLVNMDQALAQSERYAEGSTVTGPAEERLAAVRAERLATAGRLLELQNKLQFGHLTAAETAQAELDAATADVAAQEMRVALRAESAKLVQDIHSSEVANLALMQDQINLQAMSAEDRFVELEVRKAIARSQELVNKAGFDAAEISEADLQNLREKAHLLYAAQNPPREGGSGDNKVAEMEEVNRLLEYRVQLLSLAEAQEQVGDTSGATKTSEEVETVTVALDAAITNAILFWEAMGGNKAAEAIAGLEELRLSLVAAGEEALFTADFINEGLTDVLVNSFQSMAEAIANGKKATEAFFDAFVTGAGEFLIEIGKMILQMVILNALKAAFGGASGGVGGVIAGGLNAAVNHDGGTVGRDGTSRTVPSSVFAGALRYHGGGLPGLKSSEVATILERGEEVLAVDDPDNVLNGGRSSQGGVKVVMVNSPAAAMREASADTEYQRVHMEFLQENSNEVRAALGI